MYAYVCVCVGREEGPKHTVLMSLPELLTMVMVASSGKPELLILASFLLSYFFFGVVSVFVFELEPATLRNKQSPMSRFNV